MRQRLGSVAVLRLTGKGQNREPVLARLWGPEPPAGVGIRSRNPRGHFFDTEHAGTCGIAIALHGIGAQSNGRADGQQNSVAGRLCRKRSQASGPTVREACPSSSAGYRSVLDLDSAPVAGDLGRDLGGGHIIVLGFVVTA